jgi:hypothetical protein
MQLQPSTSYISPAAWDIMKRQHAQLTEPLLADSGNDFKRG